MMPADAVMVRLRRASVAGQVLGVGGEV